MLLKKASIQLLLGLTVTSNLYAGTMGAAVEGNTRGVYIEGNVGYAYHPYTQDRTTTPGLENQLGVLTNLSNINGGAIGGVDAGYQFNRYLALEGGWSYIPSVGYSRDVTVTLPVGQTTFILPAGLQVDINSGFGYVAGKGSLPLYNRIDAFGKLGAAYVYNDVNVPIPASLVNSPTVYTTNHSNFWSPLFAFGLQYNHESNLSLNVQYTYVPGYREASANHFITPDIQLITAGFGYKFFV